MADYYYEHERVPFCCESLLMDVASAFQLLEPITISDLMRQHAVKVSKSIASWIEAESKLFEKRKGRIDGRLCVKIIDGRKFVSIFYLNYVDKNEVLHTLANFRNMSDFKKFLLALSCRLCEYYMDNPHIGDLAPDVFDNYAKRIKKKVDE